jgi:hypothetical protein
VVVVVGGRVVVVVVVGGALEVHAEATSARTLTRTAPPTRRWRCMGFTIRILRLGACGSGRWPRVSTAKLKRR